VDVPKDAQGIMRSPVSRKIRRHPPFCKGLPGQTARRRNKAGVWKKMMVKQQDVASKAFRSNRIVI